MIELSSAPFNDQLDMLFKGLPIAKSAGVMASGSFVSSAINVRGREFTIASMSVRVAYSSVLLRAVLPKTFQSGVFTDVTSLSHHPPLHGDLSAINFHSTHIEADSLVIRF